MDPSEPRVWQITAIPNNSGCGAELMYLAELQAAPLTLPPTKTTASCYSSQLWTFRLVDLSSMSLSCTVLVHTFFLLLKLCMYYKLKKLLKYTTYSSVFIEVSTKKTKSTLTFPATETRGCSCDDVNVLRVRANGGGVRCQCHTAQIPVYPGGPSVDISYSMNWAHVKIDVLFYLSLFNWRIHLKKHLK